MTAIGDVIQPGQPIPDDVTAFISSGGERATRADHATDTGTPWLSAACQPQCVGHAADEFVHPLTVTAVREPERNTQEPCGICSGNGCPDCRDEPLSALLDLVRQYGHACWKNGHLEGKQPEQSEAFAEVQDLFARIAALVPQPSDPLVLSLPEVPKGALIDNRNRRWLPTERAPEIFHLEGGRSGDTMHYVIMLLDGLGPLTVEMAPPREPRTELPCGHLIECSKFEDHDGAKVLITVPPAHDSNGDAFTTPLAWCAQGHGWLSLTQDEFAELTEVFDDEPGGEQR